MINKNELRIGNYVEYSGHQVSITDITQDFPCVNMITIDYLEYEEIFPIPITEKWLLDFGFKWKNHGLRKSNICIRDFGNVYSISMSNEAFGFNINLEYVHQLQNLYFSLTFSELQLLEAGI